jgi:hypothetical protein
MTHVGISDVRIEIAHRLKEAAYKAHAARSQVNQRYQRCQRYQRGRADGLGEALQLVDAFLRSEAAGKPVEPREVEEIVTAVESIAQA